MAIVIVRGLVRSTALKMLVLPALYLRVVQGGWPRRRAEAEPAPAAT